MNQNLVFLYGGIISSFGSEKTPSDVLYNTDSRIRKSQIIGYLAACLGYDMYAEDYGQKMNFLIDSVAISYIMIASGSVFTDFQTIYHVPKKDFFYRKEEILNLSGGNRIIEKDYISEANALVSISSSNGELIDMLNLAIKKPIYTPFVGRKSNSLSLIPYPLIYQDSIDRSFENYLSNVELFKSQNLKLVENYNLYFEQALLNQVDTIINKELKSDAVSFVNNEVQRNSRIEYLTILNIKGP